MTWCYNPTNSIQRTLSITMQFTISNNTSSSKLWTNSKTMAWCLFLKNSTQTTNLIEWWQANISYFSKVSNIVSCKRALQSVLNTMWKPAPANTTLTPLFKLVANKLVFLCTQTNSHTLNKIRANFTRKPVSKESALNTNLNFKSSQTIMIRTF